MLERAERAAGVTGAAECDDYAARRVHVGLASLRELRTWLSEEIVRVLKGSCRGRAEQACREVKPPGD